MIELDADAIFWTLSTIAQALVGLVALVSFIAIWRLQSIDTTRSECRAYLAAIRRERVLVGKYGLSDARLIEMGRHLAASEGIDHDQRVELERNALTLKFFDQDAKDLRRRLFPMNTAGLATTVAAIAALPVTHKLVEHPLVGTALVVSVLAGVAVTAFYAYRLLDALLTATKWFEEPPAGEQ